MIKLEIRIFEHGDAGLKVRCFGTGEAKSEGEQLYLEILQGSLQAGLEAAAKKYAELGLAAAVEAPAPLGPDAIVLPIQLKPATPPPSPPQFSKFATLLLQDLHSMIVADEMGPTDKARNDLARKAVDIAKQRIDEFANQVNTYGKYAAEQLRRGGGKN